MAIEHILGLVVFIVIVLTLSLVLPTGTRPKNQPDGGGDGASSTGWFADGGGDCGGGDGGGGD
jgi:hypothetical protein